MTEKLRKEIIEAIKAEMKASVDQTIVNMLCARYVNHIDKQIKEVEKIIAAGDAKKAAEAEQAQAAEQQQPRRPRNNNRRPRENKVEKTTEGGNE